jgi:nucleoside phosphorylase
MQPKRVTRGAVPSRAGARVPVLILSVIMEPESTEIAKMLPLVKARRQPPTDFDRILQIERWEIDGDDGQPFEVATAYINGMGNVRSAIETLIYLQRISPKFVFLCGIAGTLDPGLAGFGDVIIAKTVQWWNLNKVTKDSSKAAEEGDAKYLQLGDHFLRKQISTVGEPNYHWDKRLTSFVSKHRYLLRADTDPELLRLKADLQGDARRHNVLHYDKIVSWEYVLSDETIRGQLRKDSAGGLGIEMEGAGFCSSITRQNEEVNKMARTLGKVIPGDTIGFVFRGISDLCHDKGRERQEWRRVAMSNAADILVTFLKTFSQNEFRI